MALPALRRCQRGCLGEHFAMYETVGAVARSVQRMRIESFDDVFPADVRFTMTATGPVRARLTQR